MAKSIAHGIGRGSGEARHGVSKLRERLALGVNSGRSGKSVISCGDFEAEVVVIRIDDRYCQSKLHGCDLENEY
jgi:hypothetical protein